MKITRFFLLLIKRIPELLSKFEGDVFSVVELLIQLSFQFLVDPFVLLVRHHERLELEKSHRSYQSQLTRAKEFEK